jgi:hypothetical protein
MHLVCSHDKRQDTAKEKQQMSIKFTYTRVSTSDQNLGLQSRSEFLSLHDHMTPLQLLVNLLIPFLHHKQNLKERLSVNVPKRGLMLREQDEKRKGDQKAYLLKICNWH